MKSTQSHKRKRADSNPDDSEILHERKLSPEVVHPTYLSCITPNLIPNVTKYLPFLEKCYLSHILSKRNVPNNQLQLIKLSKKQLLNSKRHITDDKNGIINKIDLNYIQNEMCGKCGIPQVVKSDKNLSQGRNLCSECRWECIKSYVDSIDMALVGPRFYKLYPNMRFKLVSGKVSLEKQILFEDTYTLIRKTDIVLPKKPIRRRKTVTVFANQC